MWSEIISIHALREEGDADAALTVDNIRIISIHALREEGDAEKWLVDANELISIHALREEGDDTLLTAVAAQTEFLSTPSARRATLILWKSADGVTDFYPRPPRGGRPSSVVRSSSVVRFLSTPSARRATGFIKFLHGIESISIHALREEGDDDVFLLRRGDGISIHALREEGDLALLDPVLEHPISIHALREEGDQWLQHLPARHLYFYPRPPRGGRP